MVEFESKSKKLEVKEGILLDREGNPVHRPTITHFFLGPWVGVLFVILFVFAGLTLATTITVVFIGIWIIRSIFRLLGVFGHNRETME